MSRAQFPERLPDDEGASCSPWFRPGGDSQAALRCVVCGGEAFGCRCTEAELLGVVAIPPTVVPHGKG